MTSAEPEDRGASRARVGSAPGDPSAAGAVRGSRDAVGGGGPGERALATRVVTLDREGERATRLVDVEVPAMVKRAGRQREGQLGGPAPTAAGELVLLGELPAWIGGVRRQLHPRDRTTLWALGVCFLGGFVPWYHVRVEGLLAGVEGLGLLSAAQALLAVGLLVGRTLRRRWALELLVAQTVLIAGAIAVPVYELLRGALGAWYLGAGLTVAAGGVALGFSLARLSRLGGG
ncbi:MAG: hypothetical protein IPG96_17060 [Proteobacteria bacterium]|nr:hypothetical protein [Pseudomonadota bacterium]